MNNREINLPSVDTLISQLEMRADKLRSIKAELEEIGIQIHQKPPEKPRRARRNTSDLRMEIMGYIMERPRTFRDICAELEGSDTVQIANAIQALKREFPEMQNLGTRGKALWYLPGQPTVA